MLLWGKQQPHRTEIPSVSNYCIEFDLPFAPFTRLSNLEIITAMQLNIRHYSRAHVHDPSTARMTKLFERQSTAPRMTDILPVRSWGNGRPIEPRTAVIAW